MGYGEIKTQLVSFVVHFFFRKIGGVAPPTPLKFIKNTK
jgi:hypothetical protein